MLTQPALGHVDVRPRLVEQGREAALRVELPQLRAGAPPVGLEVEGDGVEFLTGSLLRVAGPETIWRVLLRITSAAPTGELLLVLRASFADGATVEVDGSVVVVPPAETASSFPWLGAVAGVTIALAVAAVVLIRSRRRSAC